MNETSTSPALKLAIVGPTHPEKGAVAAHTTTLAHRLTQAGHDVTLLSWSHPFAGSSSPAVPETSGCPPTFPRTIRALSWARPDTWVRSGRRLRGLDAIIVVHVQPIVVPAHLCVLRAAGAAGGTGDPREEGTPRSIVIAHNVVPHQARPGDRTLIRSLFGRVNAVLVHSPEQGLLAQELHAARVSVADPGESGSWTHYVEAMEALASPRWQTAGQSPPRTSTKAALTAPSWPTRLAAPVRRRVRSRRPTLSMTRRDLPELARPSDVLVDGADAEAARDWARSYGLPRCADPIAAWSALGALAAIVRFSDDGHRSALIIDGSGARSPLATWARAIGFEPVGLDLTGSQASVAEIEVDPASLDVITRLHPNGCDAQDVDETLSQASSALRHGGLISLTLPLGPASAAGAVGPADVRALLARAHDLGLVLVGDLDGEFTTLMRTAGWGVHRSDAAYAVVRLTFRRR